ncbi:hypothetical protein [Ancylobacter pratisalsi]|uniref:CRIB domain-containing protein n=1 Tax=Ancylobacter pratisalsi TaxID=1745854 RepID=A0A6P1YPX7_9HYPH|nr:hypothetical protein [Ancylobacter pratisalsi]QIB35105.1 hypothetical protein G3A50_16365 [Ancylobacter pratisalsi]
MTDTIQIPLHWNTNAPMPEIRLEAYDFTDKQIELAITPDGGPLAPFVLSTEAEGGLSLLAPNGEGHIEGCRIDDYSAFVNQLPLGENTRVDMFALTGAQRQKVAAGTITIGGAGEYLGAEMALVQVPGIQGAPGVSLFTGDGAPAPELGVTGDRYIDNLTLDLWGPKSEGGWGASAAGSWLGPIVSAPNASYLITGDITFDHAVHVGQGRVTVAGEVEITLPNDTPVGFGGIAFSPDGSTIAMVAASGASLENPYDHTHSLPKGLIVWQCVANADDESAVWAISGATQP